MLLANFLMIGNGEAVADLRPAEGVNCATREPLPEQIRPLNCALATIAAAGIERSATFRRLVEQMKGIVYVMPTHIVQGTGGRALDGGLIHV